MWFNRPTTDRNYSGEQKVSFESPVPFSKCLRAKIYCNMNVHFDPQGCQTLLLKESEPFLLSLGSWTTNQYHKNSINWDFPTELQTSRDIEDNSKTKFSYFSTKKCCDPSLEPSQ